MADIEVVPLNTKGTLEEIIAGLRKENTRLTRDYRDLQNAASQLVAEKNDKIEKLTKQLQADEAWMRVAIDSNKAVDDYLRKVDPSLPKHYGMPVDGVRRVVDALLMQIDALRGFSGTKKADSIMMGEPSENPDSGYDTCDDACAPSGAYGDPTVNPYP